MVALVGTDHLEGRVSIGAGARVEVAPMVQKGVAWMVAREHMGCNN